jgi:hypothetical protein
MRCLPLRLYQYLCAVITIEDDGSYVARWIGNCLLDSTATQGCLAKPANADSGLASAETSIIDLSSLL